MTREGYKRWLPKGQKKEHAIGIKTQASHWDQKEDKSLGQKGGQAVGAKRTKGGEIKVGPPQVSKSIAFFDPQKGLFADFFHKSLTFEEQKRKKRRRRKEDKKKEKGDERGEKKRPICDGPLRPEESPEATFFLGPFCVICVFIGILIWFKWEI